MYGHVYGKSGSAGSQQETGDSDVLPQALADRLGWEEQVALIAQVYHGLPMDEGSGTNKQDMVDSEGQSVLKDVDEKHMPELPEVGDGVFCYSLLFAIVRVVLLERFESSLVFANGYCQSSALLSVLLSTQKSL